MEEQAPQETVQEVAQEIIENAVEEQPAEGEPAIAEGAAPESVPEPPPLEPQEDFSARFAALARRDRKLRDRENRLKGLEAEAEKATSANNQYGDIEKLARENPFAAMEKLGISYQQLTEQVLNDGTLTDEYKLKQENATLTRRLEALEAKFQEKQKEAEAANYKSAYGKFIDEIKDFAENDGSYELVQARNAYPLVGEVMQEHYNRNHTVMPYEEALKLVESHFESEAQSYLGSKKLEKQWRERYGAAPATAEAEAGQNGEGVAEAAPPAEKPKTLTNNHSAQSVERETGLLSRSESLERMAQILRGSV